VPHRDIAEPRGGQTLGRAGPVAKHASIVRKPARYISVAIRRTGDEGSNRAVTDRLAEARKLTDALVL
jgi:hypothetical protein